MATMAVSRQGIHGAIKCNKCLVSFVGHEITFAANIQQELQKITSLYYIVKSSIYNEPVKCEYKHTLPLYSEHVVCNGCCI
jgi:hypothetical protein